MQSLRHSELRSSVWEIATGRRVRHVYDILVGDDHCGALYEAYAIAPDSRTVAVACSDGFPVPFILCDLSTGRTLREFRGPDKTVTALAFTPDGRHVLSFNGDRVIRSWSTATGEIVREFVAPDRPLTSMALSPDGRILAAGADVRDGTAAVFLWDTATGQLRRTLAGHTAAVRALAFTPDGRQLVTGGNAIIRLWDVAAGREMRQFRGHEADLNGSKLHVDALAVSPDGRTLASSSDDYTTRVWELATGTLLGQPGKFLSSDNGLVFADDRTLVIGAKLLLVWDVPTRSFKNRLASPEFGFRPLCFTSDGRALLSAGGDGIFRWDASDGRVVSSFRVEPWSSEGRFAPDGRRLALTVSPKMTVALFDTATGRELRRLPGDDHMPVAFSPDGRRLATLSHGGVVARVFDTITGAQIARLDAPPDPIPPRRGTPIIALDAAFAPDGLSLFIAYQFGPVRQWGLAGGKLLREFAGTHRTDRLAPTPDGRRLAVASGGALRLIEVTSGEDCAAFTVPGMKSIYPTCIAFSPDGALVAATHEQDSSDEELRQVELWEVRTGRWRACFPGHPRKSAIGSLAFSPDGHRLASGSEIDALVWDVSGFAPLPAAARLDETQQRQLWDDLAGDAKTAYQAIGRGVSYPAAAVALLRRRLGPVRAVPAERVGPLLASLNPTFAAVAAVEQATKDLIALGPSAEPAVRAALATASAEAKRRLEPVFASWEADVRRAGRAVEILETVATPDARSLQEELAKGDPAARLTREAKASLDRLRRDRQ